MRQREVCATRLSRAPPRLDLAHVSPIHSPSRNSKSENEQVVSPSDGQKTRTRSLYTPEIPASHERITASRTPKDTRAGAEAPCLFTLLRHYRLLNAGLGLLWRIPESRIQKPSAQKQPQTDRCLPGHPGLKTCAPTTRCQVADSKTREGRSRAIRHPPDSLGWRSKPADSFLSNSRLVFNQR
ncbi:hypothetical protein AOLI_G00177050 [Acnodon oligacanthus]